MQKYLFLLQEFKLNKFYILIQIKLFLILSYKIDKVEEKDNSKNKLKLLVNDLKSQNENKILAALNSLQVNGDASVILPLLETLRDNISEKVNNEIILFLGDLKDTTVKAEIINVLRDDNFSSIRQGILTSIWQCKIDYSDFISDFVAIACEGTFEEAFECLTILENLEGPFEERHVLESQLHLKEYIEDTSPKEPQKSHVLSDIALLIKGFDLDIDLDEDDISLYE